MSDDRKDGDGVSKETREARAGAAVPEVEAEIVDDPAAPQGDLLKDELSGDDAASGGDAREGSAHEGGAQTPPPAKPRTPGVAIFAVFAAGALAVFAYWLWQTRDSGAATASASVSARPDAQEPPASDSPEPSVDDASERAGAAEVESGDPPETPPVENQDVVEGQGEAPRQALSGQTPSEQFVPAMQEVAQSEAGEGASTPDEGGIAPGDGVEPLADDPLAQSEDGGEGLQETLPAGAPPEEAFAEARDDAPGAEASVADEGVEGGASTASADAAPAGIAAIDEAADSVAGPVGSDAAARELETLREGFAREIEALAAALGAEREKSAALEAEMAVMRASFDETLRAREAAADAALSSLRGELATARRALAPPDAAGEAAEALARLGRAVEAGGAFTSELEAVAGFTADEEALASLRRRAAEGAPTRRELKARFAEAAREALAAADQEEAEGFIGNLEARVKSLVSIRPATPRLGDSPRAVMSRIEDAVRRDAYGLALSGLAGLPEPAQAELEDWAAEARIHEEVRTALTALNGAVLAQAAR